MKKQFVTLACATLLGLAVQQTRASVVVSNLDPGNFEGDAAFGSEVGQSMLTASRPIELTSVMFAQSQGTTSGETFSVYGRNADGTLGAALFSDFALTYDTASRYTTATVNDPFTLQAYSGYWFVLASTTTDSVLWDYTTSTDYAAGFGATLPDDDTALQDQGAGVTYYSLGDGPQLIQVNGLALATVPEPSTWALTGLALASGVVLLARRRAVAA